MNSDYVSFSLFRWKSEQGNKNFELFLHLSRNDCFGWHDYYKIDFVCNNKIKNSYTGRKTILDKDYYSFGQILSNHRRAQRCFQEFHSGQINVLGLEKTI